MIMELKDMKNAFSGWNRSSEENQRGLTGFAVPMIVSVLTLALIIGSIVYVSFAYQPKESGVIEDYQWQSAAETPAADQTRLAPAPPVVIEMKKGGEVISEKKTAPDDYRGGMILAGRSAPLFIFDAANFEFALRTNRLVVLYFYANWSPVCQAEILKLYESFNRLTTNKVIGFRIDFSDSNTDKTEQSLARQFGILSQNSKVFLKNGAPVLVSADVWDAARYIEEINRVLNQ